MLERLQAMSISSSIPQSLLHLLVLSLFWAMPGVACAQVKEDTQLATPAQEIIIPDGTRIELRFAQGVWGQAAGKTPVPLPDGVQGEAHRGDVIRLIATANLRVDGRVVVTKGAVGHAIITDIVAPLLTTRSKETGLYLRLEWIKSINDVEIPLRVFKKGDAGPFYAQAMTDHGGTTLRPVKISRLLVRMPNFEEKGSPDKKNWIPKGTRITVFVHGPAALNRSEVEQAQAQLPLSGAAALVTIYRTDDHTHDLVTVSCDGERIAQIGERQYASKELAPGAHSCQIDGEGEKALAIVAVAGEEYYARLHPRGSGKNWELKLVPAVEGENAVAAAEMAPQ